MAARYTRDEIISQGLELAASPTVLQHDMPGGIVQSNAYAIKWLQNALDMFHNKFPFSCDVTSTSITFPTGSDTLYVTPGVYLPTDYIIDVRNGVLFTLNNQTQRLQRQSFQYFLNSQLSYQNLTTGTSTGPQVYCKINNQIKFTPRVSTTLTGTLWYYALPTLLEYNSIPGEIFPDEHTLIEFVRLKALEWTRSIDVGTATAYLQKELVRLRSDGLIDDSEYDVPPIENNQVLLSGYAGNVNAWMGPIGLAR